MARPVRPHLILQNEAPETLFEDLLRREFHLACALVKQFSESINDHEPATGKTKSRLQEILPYETRLLSLLFEMLESGESRLFSRSDVPDLCAVAIFDSDLDDSVNHWCAGFVEICEELDRAIHKVMIVHSWQTNIDEVKRVREILRQLPAGTLIVLRMVLQGIATKNIASNLAVSQRTIEARRQKITMAFQVSTMIEVANIINRTVGMPEAFAR